MKEGFHDSLWVVAVRLAINFFEGGTDKEFQEAGLQRKEK